MGEALGLGEGGSRLPSFIKGEKIAPFVGRELGEKLENPLIFHGLSVGANLPPPMTHGYDATILIDLCKAVLQARSTGKLLRRQQHIANQAQVIVNASAKTGIKGLVYALSGYDATKEEVIAAFRLFVREEARDEKEFPNQLYTEWCRLYQLPKPDRNKPWKFMHLTVNQVYWPVAKSNGQILQLTRALRATSNERYKKLHQFLSKTGVKALRQPLGQLLGVAQVSGDQAEYERHVENIFGSQRSLDFEGPPP